jgi:hypothetical protein
MKKLLIASTILAAMTSAASEDAVLLKKLATAKMTLKDVVAYAEKTSGTATSAKFEMDGEQLVFSVYTVPQGLMTAPDQTDLTEIAGSATVAPIAGKAEVFTDKEHIARASSHQTLMQLSNLTLSQIIDRALEKEAGTAFSVKNPVVRNHRPVADVLVLDDDGDVETVSVDMLTGKIN